MCTWIWQVRLSINNSHRALQGATSWVNLQSKSRISVWGYFCKIEDFLKTVGCLQFLPPLEWQYKRGGDWCQKRLRPIVIIWTKMCLRPSLFCKFAKNGSDWGSNISVVEMHTLTDTHIQTGVTQQLTYTHHDLTHTHQGDKKKTKYHREKVKCPLGGGLLLDMIKNPFPQDYTSSLQNFPQKKCGLFELWPPVSLRKPTRTFSVKWSFSLVPFSLQQEEKRGASRRRGQRSTLLAPMDVAFKRLIPIEAKVLRNMRDFYF